MIILQKLRKELINAIPE